MDARIILSNKFQSFGLSKRMSNLIALDAGSSQISVNREYLFDKGISKLIIDKIFNEVVKFYFGEFENYNE